MFMSDPKKKAATIIASMGAPMHDASKAPAGPDGTESDNSIALQSASEEIMHAVEAKDAKALVAALKSFIEMCDDDDSQEEPPEDPLMQAGGHHKLT